MKRAGICAGLLLIACASFAGTAAHGQTDIALNLYGAFTSAPSTSGAAVTGTTVSPSDAAGGLIELRHIRNSLGGFEATYSFNRANQADSSSVACPGGPAGGCGITTTEASVPATMHEIAGAWAPSLRLEKFRLFALAGGGLLFDVPTTGTVNATIGFCLMVNPLCKISTSPMGTRVRIQGAFDYGGGVDWGMLPHAGLRLQYRGIVYKEPALLEGFSIDSLTHTAEPMIGAYFQF